MFFEKGKKSRLGTGPLDGCLGDSGEEIAFAGNNYLDAGDADSLFI